MSKNILDYYRQFLAEGMERPSQGFGPVAGDDDIQKLAQRLSKKHGVDLRMNLNRNNDLHLHHIAVPKEKRKQGIGSAVMKDINSYADSKGHRVTLNLATKDDHFGTTSTSRLKKFYKGHGYVPNSGRKKDFTTSASMYREPKGTDKP